MTDLRLGRWQDVLADVECDALICDPPFGARTHAAWREGERATASGYRRGVVAETGRAPITYGSWTPEDVFAFVKHWSARTAGWIVALTSHDLAPSWQGAFEACGRYSFAPLPCVTWGGSIRLAGDGPSSWTVWAMVARPKTRKFQKWGTLPGAYVTQGGQNVWNTGGGGGRGKPIELMRQIVRDYSRPGDLICDPTAGLATTGVAAITMGRRFVGAEMDAETHAKGTARLAEAVARPELWDPREAKQEGLL